MAEVGPTTVDDLSTVDGLEGALVRALQQGDVERAAALHEPTWRYATDMWNSEAG